MAHKRNPEPVALFRHGDVLVAQVPAIPVEALRRPHLVLAEGEMTGHVHRIAEPNSAELFQRGSEMFLRVLCKTATLIHQEHGPIELPQGEYRVWRQREYSPREIRQVRD
jgi:hypothetical protein